MRIYIPQTENGQVIINLDSLFNKQPEELKPEDLNGKTIKSCIKDKCGDVVLDLYDY